MTAPTFAIRPVPKPEPIRALARAMYEGALRARLARTGCGQWVAWEILPRIDASAQESWIDAAQAAVDHITLSPSFPLQACLPGGHHG